MITTVQLTLEEYSGLYTHDTTDFLRFESNVLCSVEYDLLEEPLSSLLGYTVVIDEENNISLTCSHSENYNGKRFKIIYEGNAVAELPFNQDIVHYI